MVRHTVTQVINWQIRELITKLHLMLSVQALMLYIKKFTLYFCTYFVCTNSVVTMDSSCSSKTAAGNAVKMYIEEEVDVFIGPPCSVGK